MNISLDDRAETLLKMLIARFVDQGQPVGSRTLSQEKGLELSPATIRNVMSDLEALGLIRSPHASAGRVPTAQGYRFFIDSLLKVQPLNHLEQDEIKERLNQSNDAQELMAAASELLSEVTQFAGVVFQPNISATAFRQIEFVKLSTHRVLVILVTEDGRVQNRVIASDRDYGDSELTQAANFFNHAYKGQPLSSVKNRLLREMKSDSEQINQLMETAMKIASGVIVDQDSDDDVMLSGEENLLNVPDFAAIEKIRKIFETFKTRHSLLTLLDQSIKASGVSIFVGDESGYSGLNECSVVTAPYEVDGQSLGVLGVIGPTRMHYEHVISVVDVTAQMLGNALTHLAHDQ